MRSVNFTMFKNHFESLNAHTHSQKNTRQIRIETQLLMNTVQRTHNWLHFIELVVSSEQSLEEEKSTSVPIHFDCSERA